MNRVFQRYIYSFVIVFIDKIFVYSKNKGEHKDHLRVVLLVIKLNQLLSKYRKYKFWLSLVMFLGHIICIEGVELDSRKIDAVKNWPRQFTLTYIRIFFCLVGYYRRFVYAFASI